MIVNTAKGLVGENTAALIGSTLINLAALVVGEQAARPPTERRRVVFLVDEFQALPGADYELILSELGKYGASLMLATQSLARLDALDAEHGRALRPTVFANLNGLFAFNTSAEDARHLVPELGGEIDEQDLVELGQHQCYVRITAGGEPLPVFSVRLGPPPAGDPAVRDELAAASARRYGRDRVAVEEGIRATFDHVEAPSRRRPRSCRGSPHRLTRRLPAARAGQRTADEPRSSAGGRDGWMLPTKTLRWTPRERPGD